jgi:protoporphyrinogen oxidase
MPIERTSHLIVGGGPAGLSAALHLEGNDFLLMERDSRTGGLCKSVPQDGFTFDYAGHIFFTRDKYVDGLYRDVLAGNWHEQVRESWIYMYGSYMRYPFQANLFGLPPAALKDCLKGVIDATIENRLRPADAPKPADFREWCYRVMGKGITEHFMLPYNAKVWGIDPARMSHDWIGDRVATPSLDEVIDGAIQRGKGDWGPNGKFGYPLHGGCEAFVAGLFKRAVAKAGKDNFRVRRKLTAIQPEAKLATFEISDDAGRVIDREVVLYDKLFPSVALPDLIDCIADAPSAVREAAHSLPSTSTVVVNLGIDRVVTDKHWIYYPEGQDKYIMQRIFVQSNASRFTAPEGCSGLTFEISFSQSKPLPVKTERELIDACIAALKRTDLWQEGDRVVTEQVLWLNDAYIPFTPDRQPKLDIINAYLYPLDIYPIGRFGEWKYLNQDGAILSAKRIVEMVRNKERPDADKADRLKAEKAERTERAERGEKVPHPAAAITPPPSLPVSGKAAAKV